MLSILSLGTGAIILLVLFGWLLPIIVISISSRASGREKLAWILAVIFVSWFAWIFYLLLAPVSKR